MWNTAVPLLMNWSFSILTLKQIIGVTCLDFERVNEKTIRILSRTQLEQRDTNFELCVKLQIRKFKYMQMKKFDGHQKVNDNISHDYENTKNIASCPQQILVS